MLNKDHQTLKTWRAVAEKWGINPGMAFMIARRGYEPKTSAIRTKLGMSAMTLAPVCPKCGKLHISKKCTHKTIRKWRDLPTDQLRYAIEHREVI